MLNALFAEINTGRLGRLAYLAYSLLLAVLGLLALFGLDAAFGLTPIARAPGSDETQSAIWNQLGILGMGLTALSQGALLFAQVNISAKRIRDIGLPGWWLILTIAVIGAFTFILGDGPLFSGVYLLIGLSLLILPSESFAKYDEAPDTASPRPDDPSA